MQFVGEIGLHVTNAGQIVERALKELSPFYVTLKRENEDVILDLSESTARIRVHGMDIWVRVEAPDLPLCHGTKMLIESALFTRVDKKDSSIPWIVGSEEPFAMLGNFLASRPSPDGDAGDR